MLNRVAYGVFHQAAIHTCFYNYLVNLSSMALSQDLSKETLHSQKYFFSMIATLASQSM